MYVAELDEIFLGTWAAMCIASHTQICTLKSHYSFLSEIPKDTGVHNCSTRVESLKHPVSSGNRSITLPKVRAQITLLTSWLPMGRNHSGQGCRCCITRL